MSIGKRWWVPCVCLILYFAFRETFWVHSGRKTALVMYSGIFRNFDPSFKAFLGNVVLPNPNVDFTLVFHSEDGKFCSNKDISCSPAELALGQCNMCSCIYRPHSVADAIHVTTKTLLKDAGIPSSRVSIAHIFLESQTLPFARLRAAWLAARKSMDVLLFDYVLYIRPDGAPTAPVLLADNCANGDVLLMTGEVYRGADWPLHHRDYDLGALACAPRTFDTFVSGMDQPCSNVWHGCKGIPEVGDAFRAGGGDEGGQPPAVLGTVSGRVYCEHSVCGVAAAMAKKGLLLGTLDDQRIFSRIYRVSDTCSVTYQREA